MQWERFLTTHNIEYITSGPNTKKGEISVKCPWCGEEDPSQHLGINLTKEVWGCHRDGSHRGKSTVRLIQALLGCSMAQAGHLRSQYEQSDPDDLSGVLAMLEVEEAQQEADLTVEFPPEFKEFDQWPERFLKYLENRGYLDPIGVAQRFHLRCATTGRYKDRVIFPLYLNGLIGWTGRAISDPVSAPRYLASSENVKMTLYGYPLPREYGPALFIVEGPFDAMWINSNGFNAVALMGTTMTISQLILIRRLAKNFERIIILLDKGAEGPAYQLEQNLCLHNVKITQCGRSKDPASMTQGGLWSIMHWALRT